MSGAGAKAEIQPETLSEMPQLEQQTRWLYGASPIGRPGAHFK
jgi:hypothetical protein